MPLCVRVHHGKRCRRLMVAVAGDALRRVRCPRDGALALPKDLEFPGWTSVRCPISRRHLEELLADHVERTP